MISLTEPSGRAAPDLGVGSAPERCFRHPIDSVRVVLWGALLVLLVALAWRATGTTEGLTADFGRIGSRVPGAVRELALALVQVGALGTAIAVLGVLGIPPRWRRLGMVALSAGAGGGLFALLDAVVELPGGLPGAVGEESRILAVNLPWPICVAVAAAVLSVGKPWLSRPWRRAGDLALAGLVVVLVLGGLAGLVEAALAVAAGAAAGAAVLVGFGAPDRRPSAQAVATALRQAGIEVADLAIERDDGGLSQLYRVDTAEGRRALVKVYAGDSRDADLLFRTYQSAVLRGSDTRPILSLEHAVEHQALLLLLARRAGVACPDVEVLTALPDGSMLLALRHVDGPRLDALGPEEVEDDVLDRLWAEVRMLHGAGLAHRSLRAGNIRVEAGGPVVTELGFGQASASPRLLAIDRAELLASLAVLVGPDRSIASAARVIGPADLAAAGPFLQPLALSASTRKRATKPVLHSLRAGVAASSGEEPAPLERLARVRLRTLLMILALAGAFYVLLPQLAGVDKSFKALGSANWAWLLVAVAMSALIDVASAIRIGGAVPLHLPLFATVKAQLASSFVNRVTPANVGGMALNVRFLRKAGVAPAEAVTAVGLNSLAGGVVHLLLLVVFLAWAGRGGGSAFALPSSSKLLVVIAVVLAVAGAVAATRLGRRFIRTRVVAYARQSLSSMSRLTRSPLKLAMLFGGSAAVYLAYVGALAAAVAALHGKVAFAQVGAVFLGGSLIAAAAPTPGGLGALEAALVAGFTGVGMAPDVALAVVLSYRLVTYWLPILPGWLSLHDLERTNLL